MKRSLLSLLAVTMLAAVPAAWADAPAVSLLDGSVLCVRPDRLTISLPEQILSLPPTNKITGTILDLRFVDGDDSAVAGAFKLFGAKKVPLVILANSETTGGAAELAVRLRAAGAGLIIGSTNMSGKISPDIAVDINSEAEKNFLADPYLPAGTNEVSLAATNDLLPIIDHTSEAELVRKKIKDGEEDESEPTIRPEPAQPVIRDPELARAVDLIKALAILAAPRG
jgi:hypothetical protein